MASTPTTAPEETGKADDLLSDLAGQEIDKLLADAQIDPASDPPAESAVAPPAAPLAEESTQRVDDADLDAADAAELTPEEAAREVDAAVEAQLDDLFRQEGEAPADALADDPADASTGAARVAAPASQAGPSAPQASAAAPKPPAAPAGDPPGDLHAEVGDLLDALGGAEIEAPGRDPSPAPRALDAGDRLRWLVRPLELVNAPLGGLSDEARDLVGKIALITTFNAAAVLIYVFFLR